MEHENQHPSKFMNITTGEIIESDIVSADDPDIAEIDELMIPLIQTIIKNNFYDSEYSCQGGLIFDNRAEYFADSNILTAFDNPYVVVYTYTFEQLIRLITRLSEYTIFSFTINITETNIAGRPKDYKINISMSDAFANSLFEVEEVAKKATDDINTIKDILNRLFESNREKWIKTLIDVFCRLYRSDK